MSLLPPRSTPLPIAWLCLVMVLGGASTVFAIDNIRVSYATLSAAYMDHICAMDKGYFREEGINVEVIRAPGGVATPGLLSGQFQFSSSASSAVSAAVRGGRSKSSTPTSPDRLTALYR